MAWANDYAAAAPSNLVASFDDMYFRSRVFCFTQDCIVVR